MWPVSCQRMSYEVLEKEFDRLWLCAELMVIDFSSTKESKEATDWQLKAK